MSMGAPAGGAAPGGQSTAQFGGQDTGGAGCAFGAHAATQIGPGGIPVCGDHATQITSLGGYWGYGRNVVVSPKRKRKRSHHS